MDPNRVFYLGIHDQPAQNYRNHSESYPWVKGFANQTSTPFLAIGRNQIDNDLSTMMKN